MSIPRTVRLFKNGRDQMVRIPGDMELPGDEALIYRDGSRLILEATARPSLQQLLQSWDHLDADWPEITDTPPKPVDLDAP
ncbi:MAG: antitoxin [Dehalococcoidia bacterium]